MNQNLSKPDGALFWHLTALSNMQNILKEGLLSRDKLIFNEYDDISPSKLNQKRMEKGLDKFIPFHFFPLNPFDISVFKQSKNKEYCYITILQDTACCLKCKIVLEYPNHKNIEELLLEYNYENKKKIDEKINNIRKNTDYSKGKDKLESLGECLVPDSIKPIDFYSIIIKNIESKEKIEKWSKEFQGNYKYIIDIRPGYFECL